MFKSPAIAIYGGSFDPVHNGHVAVVTAILERFQFQTLWVVPSKIPPHKQKSFISEEHRLAMLELAFKDKPNVKISRNEIDSSHEISYSLHSIQHFRNVHKGSPLFFIMGLDAFLLFPNWYGFPEILNECSFLVVSRKGWSEKKLEALKLIESLKIQNLGTIELLDLDLPEISSSEVRARIQEGLPYDDLVPGEVASYLKTHSLYVRRNTQYDK